MNTNNPKLPNPNAVKELRERNKKRKADRFKKYDELAEALKKKNPVKKIAKNNGLPDAEL